MTNFVQQKQEEQRKRAEILQREREAVSEIPGNQSDDDGESETDDESSDDDYGPTPEAAVWVGEQKLQTEMDVQQKELTHSDVENEEDRPNKKARAS